MWLSRSHKQSEIVRTVSTVIEIRNRLVFHVSDNINFSFAMNHSNHLAKIIEAICSHLPTQMHCFSYRLTIHTIIIWYLLVFAYIDNARRVCTNPSEAVAQIPF